MSKYVIILTIVVLFTCKSYSQDSGYYWADYNGTIPDDAVEGGYDINGDSIFIGQAKVGDDVIVTAIYPNISHVRVPSKRTAVRVESGIKILCGSEPAASWIRAGVENLHVVLIGKNVVRGGKLKNEGYLHVGRIFYENEIKIGPILSFNLETPNLAFVHGEKVLNADKYEVLEYDSPKRRRPWRRRGRGPH